MNRYFGPQFGTRVVFDMGRLNVILATRASFGVMYQEANIAGSTTFASAAGDETRQGGFLALRGNIGEHERTKFAMLGDFSLRLHYRASEQVSFGLGYSLLLVSNVLRPGGQIDPVVNPALLPFSGGDHRSGRRRIVGKQLDARHQHWLNRGFLDGTPTLRAIPCPRGAVDAGLVHSRLRPRQSPTR